MNKIKIVKEITPKGRLHISLFLNGKESELSNDMTQKLTGAWGKGRGIFDETNQILLMYGHIKRKFVFHKELDYHNMSAEEIGEELKRRITEVQKWVKECQSKAGTQVYTFTIPAIRKPK